MSTRREKFSHSYLVLNLPDPGMRWSCARFWDYRERAVGHEVSAEEAVERFTMNEDTSWVDTEWLIADIPMIAHESRYKGAFDGITG